MPTYSITSPEGKVYSIDGPAGATQEQVIAQIQAAQKSAPVEQPGILARIKNAVIAPEGERDATLGDAVEGGITGIPLAIAQDFTDSAHQLGTALVPDMSAGSTKAGAAVLPFKAGFDAAGKEALALGGMALSPLTGTLKSVLGRPVEETTGIRRGLVGDVASAFVPLGGLANDASKLEKVTAALKPGAAEAHAAGYVLPPKMISDKPGIVANTLAAWSGKVKTAQAASAKNQSVTNTLAAKSLGLPEDAELTGDTFKTIRREAGATYKAIPQALPELSADEEYLTTVGSLSRPGAESAQKMFPNTTKNQGIIDLQDELSSVRQFPTDAGIELVKELRSQASANFKAFNDPSKLALGQAQRNAAEAIDDLIARKLAANGNADLVADYQAARVKIAKSYDVEGATNRATGNVDARKIAALADKGKPLTDELATIAKVAKAFPKAMQSAEKFGEVETTSVLDLAGAGMAAAHGNIGVAGAILGRPLGRKAVLSKTVQNALAADSGATALDANALRRAPAVNAFAQLSQAPQN